MGTWGVGNFDSDDAREYLYVVVNRFIEEIEEYFLLKEDPDDFITSPGEDKVMPAIDMCITLCEMYNSPRMYEELAQRWRHDYLKAFDAERVIGEGSFKEKRREAIVQTFNRLDALIASQGCK